MTPTSWSESTVAGASWTQGVPTPGAAQHILFGAIILNQGAFDEPAASTYTEMTVASTTFTESTVPSTTYVETSL